MTRLLGPRPIATLGAAALCASLGFGLTTLVCHETFLEATERRHRRAEERLAELENEVERVRAARGLLEKVRREVVGYRTEISRIERILPTGMDVEAEAVAILARLEASSPSVTVAPAGSARDLELYREHPFEVTFTAVTRGELFRAVDLIQSGLPMRTVTNVTLPYHVEEPFPVRLEVSSQVYKTE